MKIFKNAVSTGNEFAITSIKRTVNNLLNMTVAAPVRESEKNKVILTQIGKLTSAFLSGGHGAIASTLEDIANYDTNAEEVAKLKKALAELQEKIEDLENA
jgi:hypothetical protein